MALLQCFIYMIHMFDIAIKHNHNIINLTIAQYHSLVWNKLRICDPGISNTLSCVNCCWYWWQWLVKFYLLISSWLSYNFLSLLQFSLNPCFISATLYTVFIVYVIVHFCFAWNYLRIMAHVKRIIEEYLLQFSLNPCFISATCRNKVFAWNYLRIMTHVKRIIE